ncbi:MAG: methylmalonyl Co-A mutase-associated GTPase MeaB [Alphaproteobacteria bacterium]
MSKAKTAAGRASAAVLADAVRGGDRRALARAITLIESRRADHRAEAARLLERLLRFGGGSVRLGISGAPGVGKSTFVETLGLHIIGQGHRVAVLAVDPSSRITGGSILGDKTRMDELARAPEAFIRPSPSAGTLGGVARRTREAILVCEAAGFDVVLVETVGVGQSETAVADMVDFFLLLLSPAGGDELQGIKKGIVELADLVVVNKADGELEGVAIAAAAEYTAALNLLRRDPGRGAARVLTCSAREGMGIAEVWRQVEDIARAATASGERDARRARQSGAWMWREVDESLEAAFRDHPAVARELERLERRVRDGEITPTAAARKLLEAFGAPADE